LLILQLGLIVGISEYSCSCLPVFARLNGNYQLIRTFTSTETISQTSLSKTIEFVLKWDGRVNLTVENMYINDSLAVSKEWLHTEDFCRKDRLKVTYADGTKREFSNVITKKLVVKFNPTNTLGQYNIIGHFHTHPQPSIPGNTYTISILDIGFAGSFPGISH
jgi:hypothetical protein